MKNTKLTGSTKRCYRAKVKAAREAKPAAPASKQPFMCMSVSREGSEFAGTAFTDGSLSVRIDMDSTTIKHFLLKWGGLLSGPLLEMLNTTSLTCSASPVTSTTKRTTKKTRKT